MVALNFQAVSRKANFNSRKWIYNFSIQSDKINMMNRAKFLQNGSCGYVLKPDYGDCYTLQSSDEKHDFGKVKYLQEIQIKN